MAKPTFKANPIQVQVPATSANLGPGFDCFGLALDLHDRYVAQILDEPGLDLDVAGEGAQILPLNDKNLLIKAMNKGFDFLGGKPKGIAVRALNLVPHGRGLGSSASAIIGGLVLARALVLAGTDKMSDQVLLDLATQMEGHPDNVAAALYGGATIAWQEDHHGKLVSQVLPLTVDSRIRAVAFIPNSELSTSKARKLLPENISHADAAANSARSALLSQALTNRPDLLFRATEDFLHQEFRESAMPKSLKLMRTLRKAGVASFISGAGPTVLTLHTSDQSELEELMRAAGDGFEAKSFGIAVRGATLL
jgi:homoserine kinase